MTAEEWFAGIGANAKVAEPVAASVARGNDSFDPLISDLQGIEPFSFDDGSGGGSENDHAVDFSEVNEAPFDPANYRAMPDLGALHDTSRSAIPAEPVVADGGFEPIEDELALELAAIQNAPEIEVAADALDAELVEEDDEFLPPIHRSWPAFVGMTSELIDRDRGGLFERLRSEKGALVEAGIVTMEPRVVPAEAPPAAALAPALPVVEEPAVSEEASEERGATKTPHLSVVVANNPPNHGLDLAALRDRLLESEAAAREVVEQLEAAVSRGTSDPALLRALGEAYLKVGKSEQAAAQFRRAMMARRRAL